jgi:hypothetical protein
MLTADHELIRGRGKYDYRTHITECFARYGIRPVTDSGYWDPPNPPKATSLFYGFSGHAEMMWDREALMRYLWENREALGLSAHALTIVNFVKPSIRTGPDGFLVRETIVEYFQLFDVLGGDLKSLGVRKPRSLPPSADVRLLGGGTLVFDDYGRLKFHVGTGVLSRRQSDRVAALWLAGPERFGMRRFSALHRERTLGPAQRANWRW